VLSTPPAFVLSQDQTLQTKPKKANHRKSDQSNQSQTGIKNPPHPNTGSQNAAKNKQQTKTTKHTIEFSNNTPAQPRNEPAAKAAY
jgi:hypothetical protein